MKKSIGILGGMGPQASIKFYSLLIEKSQKNFSARKNEDFPFIFISNIPVKDLIKDKSEEKLTKDFVKNVAKKFEAIGCDFIAMSCNTMHLYKKYLTKNNTTPFLCMIESVIKKVKQEKHKKVGLLGSTTTLSSGLYKKPLSKAGIEVIMPVETDIEKLSTCIHHIIAGKITIQDHVTLKKILQYFRSKNVDGVILGCTELPLVITEKYAKIKIFSSLEILADAVLERYYS